MYKTKSIPAVCPYVYNLHLYVYNMHNIVEKQQYQHCFRAKPGRVASRKHIFDFCSVAVKTRLNYNSVLIKIEKRNSVIPFLVITINCSQQYPQHDQFMEKFL
jgi:hypothetical protein